jgi:hypothetical protein
MNEEKITLKDLKQNWKSNNGFSINIKENKDIYTGALFKGLQVLGGKISAGPLELKENTSPNYILSINNITYDCTLNIKPDITSFTRNKVNSIKINIESEDIELFPQEFF